MTNKQRNKEENFQILELVAEKKTQAATNMNKTNATNYRISEGARIQKNHGPQSIENVKYKTKMTRRT